MNKTEKLHDHEAEHDFKNRHDTRMLHGNTSSRKAPFARMVLAGKTPTRIRLELKKTRSSRGCRVLTTHQLYTSTIFSQIVEQQMHRDALCYACHVHEDHARIRHNLEVCRDTAREGCQNSLDDESGLTLRAQRFPQRPFLHAFHDALLPSFSGSSIYEHLGTCVTIVRCSTAQAKEKGPENMLWEGCA